MQPVCVCMRAWDPGCPACRPFSAKGAERERGEREGSGQGQVKVRVWSWQAWESWESRSQRAEKLRRAQSRRRLRLKIQRQCKQIPVIQLASSQRMLRDHPPDTCRRARRFSLFLEPRVRNDIPTMYNLTYVQVDCLITGMRGHICR